MWIALKIKRGNLIKRSLIIILIPVVCVVITSCTLMCTCRCVRVYVGVSKDDLQGLSVLCSIFFHLFFSSYNYCKYSQYCVRPWEQLLHLHFTRNLLNQFVFYYTFYIINMRMNILLSFQIRSLPSINAWINC